MIHTRLHNARVTVVRPGVERLTALHAKAFKAEVSDLIDSGANQIVVDLDDVFFLDSSGLGALVGVLKKVGHRGDLVIAGLTEDVALMFRICPMDRVFRIYRDVEIAVQKMAEAA